MTLPSVELLLIAGCPLFLVFSFVAAAIAFSSWRRTALRQGEQIFALNQLLLQRLADIEARVDATCGSIAKFSELCVRPSQPGAAAPASTGYAIAVRLARGGASPQALVASCGIALHEAELVRRLHAPKPERCAVA